MSSRIVRLPETLQTEDLLAQIDACNQDDRVDGILVQLPLPPHIDEQHILEAILPHKDVDSNTLSDNYGDLY